MMQMAYLSFATRSFKKNLDNNIDAILQEARTHNAKHDITGQLIYRAGIFIQLLEGDKNVVEHLLGRIVLDNTRHENIKVLLKQKMIKRVFPDWSMAYKKLDDQSMDMVNSLVPWQKLINASNANVDIEPDKIFSLFEDIKN